MIINRFTTTGVILAGALLLAAVHQSIYRGFPLTFTKGSDLARAVNRTYQECQKSEGQPLSDCLEELMERIMLMVKAGELTREDCEVLKKHNVVKCKIKANFMIKNVKIPIDVYSNFIKNYRIY